MTGGDNTVENMKREVIERKLLAALNDETKVAALLEKQDLDVLIEALEFYEGPSFEKTRQFANDFRQLRKEAFNA